MKTKKLTKTRWKIDGFRDVDAEMVLVPGPHPYLWIGDVDGVAYAVTTTRKQLERIRDAIDEALAAHE